MDTATQILFNSPALHSLKRDQLVKLCKTHGLKANGKNTELVHRLKTHSQSLPPDAPLSVAVRSETLTDPSADTGDDGGDYLDASTARNVRPSQQWELVMENITEENESQGTLTSNGTTRQESEFGTRASTKSSSLQALASSLGLKKSYNALRSQKSQIFPDARPVVDTISQLAVPYESTPPPDLPVQTDQFVFSSPDRDSLVPGLGTRQGVEAPDSRAARLSMTAQPDTTTIRLISIPLEDNVPTTPVLRGYKPAFDLIMGTPSAKPNVWPLSPEKLTNASMATHSNSQAPAPFIFGSPQHGVSNKAFSDIAAGMMKEMQRRVQVAHQNGTADLLRKEGEVVLGKASGSENDTTLDDDTSLDRYEKVHDNVFSKMTSINDHWAARKAGVAADGSGVVTNSKKRKSISINDSGARRPKGETFQASVRVFSAGAARRMAERGTSGEDADEGGRQAKRARRGEGGDEVEEIEEGVTVEGGDSRTDKEREAIRRKLEINRARRRSSMGRSSVGRVNPNKPPVNKGFLSSARNMVKNVFGGGPTKPAVPSTSQSSNKITKPPRPVAKKPPLPVSKPSVQVASKSNRSTLSTTRTVSGSTAASHASRQISGSGLSATSNPQARSPIPSFGQSAKSAVTSRTAGTATSRVPTAPRKVSGSAASSLGTQASLASVTASPRNANGTIGSMGTRRVASGAATSTSGQNLGTTTRMRTTSTLHAPTASSLARTQATAASRASAAAKAGASVLKSVPESAGSQTQPLGQITNTKASIPPHEGNAAKNDEDDFENLKKSTSTTGSLTRHGLPMRKPRISRARVIAKLGAQRAASGSGISPVPKGAATPGAARKRSSLATGARRSYGGIKARGFGCSGDQVMMSAKKMARKSEMVNRRKSRAAAAASEGEVTPAMEVDANA